MDKENLEIHFWDWENYNWNKVEKIFKYYFNEEYKVKISYIDIDITKEKINEDIYEINWEKEITFKWWNIEWNIKNILLNNFITSIKFSWWENKDIFIWVRYSWKYIYYTVEFYDDSETFKESFSNFYQEYIDLINIIKPKISNWGRERLWEDEDRVIKEKYFEWIFWYFSNYYNTEFLILNDNTKKIDYWVIFYKTDWQDKTDLLEILWIKNKKDLLNFFKK